MRHLEGILQCVRPLAPVLVVVFLSLLTACRAVTAPADTGAAVLAERVNRAEGGPAGEQQATAYRCAGGEGFRIRFEAGAAVLIRRQGELRLEEVRSASGAKYAGAGTVLRTEGKEAVLETHDRLYEDCRVIETAPH